MEREDPTKMYPVRDADGHISHYRPGRTPEEQAEHEKQVAAYLAEVAARKPRRPNSSVYISHDEE